MATITRPDRPNLHYDISGAGDPLVLVHGSLAETTAWRFVAPGLAETFRIVTYDRRGHGRSGGSPAEGTVHDDVSDLAALIEELDLGPAHVCSTSYGTNIALRLAIERPDLVRRVVGHEPPLLSVLDGQPEHASIYDQTTASFEAVRQRLESGDNAGGVELFIEEVTLGPGSWERLPPEIQDNVTAHGPTLLGELRDPEALAIDVSALAAIPMTLLLTSGDASPPMFAAILASLAASLPDAHWHTFAGAGHLPHLTHPDDYVKTMTDYLAS